MYVIRHIIPIICTFGHFGTNIGLWRLIWWPVGCGAWLLLLQSFYLFYLCMQWMGKIMHCFLKNNTATQFFVPIVLKKIASGFNVVFECFVWYDAILSAWWTRVFTTQGSLGSPMTTICSICWWGQLFVNGNFGPWHIHTYTNGAIMSHQAMREVQEPYWLSVAISIAGKSGVHTPNFTQVRWRKLSSLQEVFSPSFFAQSNLHVFATIALPTSNST